MTDWTFVYCQLVALSIPDPLFHASNFARIPVALLWDVLGHCAKSSRTKINGANIATAKLGVLVASALGQKGTQIKVGDFLPYDIEDSEDSGVSEETKEAIRWALKNHKLPAQVLAMVGGEIS